jgi:hypothetical protein
MKEVGPKHTHVHEPDGDKHIGPIENKGIYLPGSEYLPKTADHEVKTHKEQAKIGAQLEKIDHDIKNRQVFAASVLIDALKGRRK